MPAQRGTGISCPMHTHIHTLFRPDRVPHAHSPRKRGRSRLSCLPTRLVSVDDPTLSTSTSLESASTNQRKVVYAPPEKTNLMAAADAQRALRNAYDFVRRHYTQSERVVPGYRNSQSNLSQGLFPLRAAALALRVLA